MATISRIGVTMFALTGDFEKGMKRGMKAIDGVASSARAMRSAIAGAAATLGVMAAFDGLKRLTIDQLAAIDATQKFADRIGIASRELIVLRKAAEETGVGVAALDMGLQRMTRRIAEAARGTGEAVAALRALGLDAQALAMMSPDQQFRAISQAMQGVSSQGERVRLAFKLFDSEGVALVNTLRLTAEQFDDVAAHVDRTGLAFSRLDAAQVELANDALARMRDISKGVATQLAVQIAPQLLAMANQVTAMGVNGKSVATQIMGGIEGVAVGISYVIDVVQNVRGALLLMAATGIGAAGDIAWAFSEVTGVGGETSEALLAAADELHDQAKGMFGFGNRAQDIRAFFREARVEGSKMAQAMLAAQQPVQALADGFGDLGAEIDAQLAKMRELESFAKRVFEQTRTPLEKFTAEMERLNDALREGLIDQETFARREIQLREDLARLTQPEAVRDDAPRTASFQQLDLRRIALGGPSQAARVQPVASPKIDAIAEAVRAIAQQLTVGGGLTPRAL